MSLMIKLKVISCNLIISWFEYKHKTANTRWFNCVDIVKDFQMEYDNQRVIWRFYQFLKRNRILVQLNFGFTYLHTATKYYFIDWLYFAHNFRDCSYFEFDLTFQLRHGWVWCILNIRSTPLWARYLVSLFDLEKFSLCCVVVSLLQFVCFPRF